MNEKGTMSRISLESDLLEASRLLTGEHECANEVCAHIIRNAKSDVHGAWFYFKVMEALNVVGKSITTFYQVCENDSVKMMAVLLAYIHGQLAGVTEHRILASIESGKSDFDFNLIMSEVQSRVPGFARQR